MIEVAFEQDGLRFTRYPFDGASVHPRGFVPRRAIRDVDPEADPPEVRLRAGETLFLASRDAEALRRYAAQHSIRRCPRVDVWALLLEPFLDTDSTEAAEARTLAQLAALGIARARVEDVRARVERSMLRYNAASWNWTRLGLADLLRAQQAERWLAWIPSVRRRRRAFYVEAMALAELGRGVVAVREAAS
ncbi:MAG: hypothetical protein JNL90_11190 [Planctomycetes bacterium]|nr:hypothetical protein [Planctomycetota bacterium]